MTDSNKQLPGFWEKNNRNPAMAAFILIMIIGGVYFLFQSVVMNLFVVVAQFLTGSNSELKGMSFIELQKQINDKYRVAIVVIVTLSQFLILLGVTLFVLPKWHHGNYKSYFKLERFYKSGFFIGLISGITIIPLVDWLSRWFYIFFPFLKELSEMSGNLVQSKNPVELIVLILGIGVTPAICEEVLFRGYFQRTLQRRMKSPLPFIIAGVIFALYHQNFFSLPVHILVGIYMGFLFYRYDSLFASMGFHFAYNTSLVIISYLGDQGLPAFLLTAEGNFTSLVVSASVACLAGFIYYTFRMTQPQSPEQQNQAVMNQLQLEPDLPAHQKEEGQKDFHEPPGTPEIYSDYPMGENEADRRSADYQIYAVNEAFDKTENQSQPKNDSTPESDDLSPHDDRDKSSGNSTE